MKSILRILPLFALISLIALTGCESNKPTESGTANNAAGWIAQGWADYHGGHYQDGEQSFQQGTNLANEAFLAAYEQGDVPAMNAAMLDLKHALNGLGWCALKFDDRTNSALSFEGAISIDSTYTDAIGGYAVLLQVDEQYEQSNMLIGTLLALAPPNWVFSQDSQINYLDVRLIRAENYFALAEFESARTEVIQISNILEYGAGQGAVSLNLATIEGRAALLEMIEELDLNWI